MNRNNCKNEDTSVVNEKNPKVSIARKIIGIALLGAMAYYCIPEFQNYVKNIWRKIK